MAKMTLTLHWWLIPIALMGLGLWFGSRPSKGSFDFSGAIEMIICFVAAVGITIGHFL